MFINFLIEDVSGINFWRGDQLLVVAQRLRMNLP